MARLPSFKPSNKPGTCLYCGCALKPHFRYEERALGSDAEAERLQQEHRRHPRAMQYEGLPVGWVTWVSGQPIIVVRVPAGLGLNGQGFFHSKACAALFGTLAAQHGTRFKRKSVEAVINEKLARGELDV